MTAHPNEAAPYYRLDPDTVLHAVDSTGLRTDGRLLALNSYENRVYQVGLEDGDPVIAKFYRPGRWSDEQILEEHGFTLELEAAEIPVVPPLIVGGRTLLEDAGFRFTLFRRQGGHAPELEDRDTLLWLGRFIGRIHAVGAVRPFRHRPALTPADFGRGSIETLLQGRWLLAGFMFVLTALLWLILLGWIIHLWSIIDAAVYDRPERWRRYDYRRGY